jgi:hypothetical protein
MTRFQGRSCPRAISGDGGRTAGGLHACQGVAQQDEVLLGAVDMR